MGHVCRRGVSPALLGWAKGFGVHCQSLLEAAAVQDPLQWKPWHFLQGSVCSLAACRAEQAPAGTVPCGEQNWALLATLLALALTEVRGAGFHRQLF